MEYVVNQYTIKDLIRTDGSNSWENNDWRGFFMDLYNTRSQLYEVTDSDAANWSYIANPSGGFFGFWWYFKTIPNSAYTPYLQLENSALCFKIEVKDETRRPGSREEAYHKLTKASNELDVEVSRPTRMGNGRYMTVLRWKGDYRNSKDGKLDFDATLKNLRKAQQILDKAFPQ